MLIIRRHLQYIGTCNGMKEMIGYRPNKAPDGMSGNVMSRKKISNVIKSDEDIASSYELDKLDELSVIHVSGTKGKGSVCALCESILRASGFKTGFFSSPHLVEVRERIRINGKPIARDVFTDYFYTVFNRLQETKASHGGTMPAYFRFLTLMAFHVFLEEKVDVAVVEVGLGGSYDCTNVIRKPVVVGITSLGLDHMSILGDTIEKIAWHKAAISKPGRPAFTVEQPEHAMKVVMDTANECGASSIQCVPDMSSYVFNGLKLRLGLTGRHQYTNASLALQLCKKWIENYCENKNEIDLKDGPDCLQSDAFQPTGKVCDLDMDSSAVKVGMAIAKPFAVPLSFMKGLENCYWPGRNQTVKRENVTYYIDGAHTPRSIAVCQQWFMMAAEEETWILDQPIKRILLFNSTGIGGCQFDGAAFCPNITGNSASGNSADQTVCATTSDKQMARCKRNLIAFENLTEEEAQTDLWLTIQDVARNPSRDWHTYVAGHETSITKVTTVNDGITIQSFQQQRIMYHTDSEEVPKPATAVFSNISDALQWAESWADQGQSPVEPLISSTTKQKPHVQLLVTGSLHLVGGVIKVLDPELVNRPGS